MSERRLIAHEMMNPQAPTACSVPACFVSTLQRGCATCRWPVVLPVDVLHRVCRCMLSLTWHVQYEASHAAAEGRV